MKKTTLLLISILFCTPLFSQFHDNVWIIGRQNNEFYGKYKLDFGKFPMLPESVDETPNINRTTASFCDAQGKLLSYTNGISIWNANNQIMDGGDIINPGSFRESSIEEGGWLPKGAFYLPAPGSDSSYYLIHMGANPPDDLNNIDPFVIYYSKISKNENQGQDKIKEVNIPIVVDLIQPASTVKHANGRDWWIIIAKNIENFYYKFLLTPNGIEGPYSQEIGSAPDSEFPRTSVGGSQKFSPSGNKFIDYNGIYGFSLYDFDRCTGELSNEYRLNFLETDSTGWNYDMEFSPNGRYLYISLLWLTNRFGTTSYDIGNPFLIQYDLWSDDIASSADTIGIKDSISNPPATFSGISYIGLQVAPDGKIYSFSTHSKIHSIQEPNRKGKKARLHKRYPVIDKGLGVHYPYYPNYRLGPPRRQPLRHPRTRQSPTRQLPLGKLGYPQRITYRICRPELLRASRVVLGV